MGRRMARGLLTKEYCPQYKAGTWLADLGGLVDFVSPSNDIPLSFRNGQLLLSVAYQVRLARLLPLDDNLQVALRNRVQKRSGFKLRKALVPLRELVAFARDEKHSLPQDWFAFMAAVPESRVRELVKRNPPAVGVHPSNKQLHVYANQLVAALARYRLPYEEVSVAVYERPPTQQLTAVELGCLVRMVFGAFVDRPRHQQLICRLADTSAEAGLLIGKSTNSANLIRQKRRVIKG